MNIITVNNVSFSYPGNLKNAISGVSFSAEHGEHIALVGPNGSGKTTLIQNLNGIFRPSNGEVLLDGKNIQAYPILERARRIAYVPQGGKINFPFTCFELTLMGLYPHFSLSAFPQKDAALERAEAIMKETGVWGFASKIANTLSGGELQRVLFTRALLQIFPDPQETESTPSASGNFPRLLLLDEAFSELDIAARINMMKLLNKMLKEQNFTVIGIHHDLQLAYRFCSRIIALHDGCIAADGPPDEIFTEAFFSRVFAVKAEIIHGKGFLFQDALDRY